MPTSDAGSSNLGLSDILSILRRRWIWIASSVVIVTALSLALSLTQTKQYTATSRILVRTIASDTAIVADPNGVAPFYADRQLANSLQTLQSTDLQAAVAADYKGHLDPHDVSVTAAVVGSDAIDLSITGPDPKDAADLVNLYARTYIASSAKSRSDALTVAQKAVQDQITGLDTQRAAISAPLDAIDAQLANSPNNAGLQQQANDLSARLAPQLTAIDSQRSAYIQRLQNLQLSAGLSSLESGELVTEAKPPSDPVSPKPLRDGILGIMLGLGLGIALALVREFLDDSISTATELDRVTEGALPVLGVVPRFTDVPNEVMAIASPASTPAEAFRALRTSVRFLALDRSMKVIQITSPSAGDGKSTVVANLSAVLAQAGYRVVVVSCDLRRPEIHRRFGEPLSPGLTDVLLGECLLSEAVRQTSSGVYLLPSGSRPPNPSELLGSSRTQVVLDYLSSEFDFVLLDCTPVLSVTDAVVISHLAQATLVVVAAKVTSRNKLREAMTLLTRAGAPVLGFVLNKSVAHGDYDYSYTEEVERVTSRRSSGRSQRQQERAKA